MKGTRNLRLRPSRMIAIVLALLLVASVAACSDLDDVDRAVSPDFHGCLFNNSDKKGYGFIEDVTAEDGSINVDDETRLVEIPISNRFLNITNTRDRDPGQPRFIEGRSAAETGTSQGVGVWVELQLYFKFVPAEACTWYQDHGSRNAQQAGPYSTDSRPQAPPGLTDNSQAPAVQDCASDLEVGDLGFNARGNCVTPWFSYLSQNFTVQIRGIVPRLTSQFTWEELTQNPTISGGEHDGELVWDVIGAQLGEQITTRLNRQLTGGDDRSYFCGVSVDVDAINQGECPPMEVDIIDIHTNNPELEDQAEQLVEAQQTLETATQLASVQGDINEQRAGLEANAELEALQAQQDYLNGDPLGVQCAALATIGVDCADVIRAQNGVPDIFGNEHVNVGGSSGGGN